VPFFKANYVGLVVYPPFWRQTLPCMKNWEWNSNQHSPWWSHMFDARATVSIYIKLAKSKNGSNRPNHKWWAIRKRDETNWLTLSRLAMPHKDELVPRGITKRGGCNIFEAHIYTSDPPQTTPAETCGNPPVSPLSKYKIIELVELLFIVHWSCC
jgi:hypothetical protein